MGRGGRIGRTLVDELVALAIFVSIEAQVWSANSTAASVVPAFGGLVFSVPVALRRRWPLQGALVVDVVLVVRTLIGGQQGALHNTVGVLPALLLIIYGLGAFAPPRQSRWVFGLTAILAGVNALLSPSQGPKALVPDVVVVTALPYAIGLAIRARAAREQAERERAEHIDALQEVSASTARYEERTRIARELHDVIAHSVSVMVIQAGGARMVMDVDTARAAESLRSVERAGRDALAEMRRLVGLLESAERPLTPQPRLADINLLVEQARAAGLAAEVQVDGTAKNLSAALDLCAYRLVQEALTNAVKHAAPAHAVVEIRWRPAELELVVTDDGAGHGAVVPAVGGHGLVGMRERVALHGGTLFAGPRTGGGFTVRACLPLSDERVAP